MQHPGRHSLATLRSHIAALQEAGAPVPESVARALNVKELRRAIGDPSLRQRRKQEEPELIAPWDAPSAGSLVVLPGLPRPTPQSMGPFMQASRRGQDPYAPQPDARAAAYGVPLADPRSAAYDVPPPDPRAAAYDVSPPDPRVAAYSGWARRPLRRAPRPAPRRAPRLAPCRVRRPPVQRRR